MADLEIAWTEPALTHVTEVLDFMAGFDAGAAERWYLGIARAVERAASFPRAGRVVPELSPEDVREVIVGSHRVIYRVTVTHVVIWAVWPGRRPLAEDVVADQPQ